MDFTNFEGVGGWKGGDFTLKSIKHFICLKIHEFKSLKETQDQIFDRNKYNQEYDGKKRPFNFHATSPRPGLPLPSSYQ